MRYKGEVLDGLSERVQFSGGVEKALTELSTVSNKTLRDFDRRDQKATESGIKAIIAGAKKLEKAVKDADKAMAKRKSEM
jgi:hypothetical protein